MAEIRVISSGSDDTPYDTWETAATSLETAINTHAAALSVQDIWVDYQHSELKSSADLTLASGEGTAAAPLLISSRDSGDNSFRAGALFGTSGNKDVHFDADFCVYDGVDIRCSSGAVGTDLHFMNAAGTGWWYKFKNCTIELAATAATAEIFMGLANGAHDDWLCEWENVILKIANVSQTMNLAGPFTWRGGSVDSGGSAPTNLITPTITTGRFAQADIIGVDLDHVSGNLVSAATGVPSEVNFRHCDINSGVTVKNGTITGPGGAKIFLHSCDSGGANYRTEKYVYQGQVEEDSATYVTTDGTSNGTTPLSLKMTSLAGASIHNPLKSLEIPFWNETTGSSQIVEIELLHDSVTDLTLSDIFLGIEYLGTSTSMLATIDNSSSTIAAGTGTGNWTISPSMTNANSQKLSVSFTAQVKGQVRIIVHLAKPSYTVFVNAKPGIS